MEAENFPFYIFNTHLEADEAIQWMYRSGFDMKKLSLIGKGCITEEHPVGFYTIGDQVRTWGGIGAFWGRVWGLLLAPAVFYLPGLGLLTMAGPVVTELIAVLEGAVVVGGVSALGVALTQVGVPKDQVIQYETALKADKYILMVHGSAEELMKASSVLATCKLWEAE